MSAAEHHASGRLHYAWVIAMVTFLVLLITSGIRATPGLFMVPLEGEFGWSRAMISASIAVNIALFGLIGPFAASVMDRWGLRRLVLGALALLAGAVAASTRMHAEWHFLLFWGVLVGAGTGVTAMVLAAVIATRWFDQRRGVVLGALSAANATGPAGVPAGTGLGGRVARLAIGRLDRRGRGRRGLRHRLAFHARSARRRRAAAVRAGARRARGTSSAASGADSGAGPGLAPRARSGFSPARFSCAGPAPTASSART